MQEQPYTILHIAPRFLCLYACTCLIRKCVHTFDDFNLMSVKTRRGLAFSHAGAAGQEVDVGEDFADQFADEFRAFVNELQLVVRGTLDVDSSSWHQFHLLKKIITRKFNASHKWRFMKIRRCFTLLMHINWTAA